MSETLDGRTAEELEALCREWQARIGCADWDVKVKIGGLRDIGHPIADGDTSGTVDWVLAKKQAVITLLDPRDYPKDSRWEQDHELTLVHELIHLAFAPFAAEDGTPADVAQEQAVHALSKALVALKRENEPDPRADEQDIACGQYDRVNPPCVGCGHSIYLSDPSVSRESGLWHTGCWEGVRRRAQEQPELTVAGLEKGLEDWKAAVEASPNPEELKPLDPKRLRFERREHAQEQESDKCLTCSGPIRLGQPFRYDPYSGKHHVKCPERREHEQERPITAFHTGGPAMCVVCGFEINASVHPCLERDGAVWHYHEDCFDANKKAPGTVAQRREHEQEQHGCTYPTVGEK